MSSPAASLDEAQEVLPLSATLVAHDVIVGLANEGIPLAAIARACAIESGNVRVVLSYALGRAAIAEMPKHDWPPTSKNSDRLPTQQPTLNHAAEFQAKTYFHLTPLEAAFVVALLRHDHCSKERLHGIIEHQRALRQTQPDRREPTDQKMVDVMICKLRKKMAKADPSFVIETSWGSGYYIEKRVRDAVAAAISAVEAVEASHDGPDGERLRG